MEATRRTGGLHRTTVNRSDIGYNSAMIVMGQEQKITDPIGVEEAAKILNCSTTHVTRLLRDGHLVGRKMSARVWVISLESVRHYFRNRPRVGRPPLA